MPKLPVISGAEAKYLRKSILTFCPLALWERVGVRVKKLAKYFCVGTYTSPVKVP